MPYDQQKLYDFVIISLKISIPPVQGMSCCFSWSRHSSSSSPAQAETPTRILSNKG